MPGFLLHVGATVTCYHAGSAQASVPNPRVTVMGMPTVTVASPYLVAGCGLAAAGSPPCVSAQWVSAAVRITSNGQPLLLLDSQALCTPTGQPLLVLATQTRASGM
ncbi:MAG: hypothetical protein ACJ8LG_03000 [Massilia sp.]